MWQALQKRTQKFYANLSFDSITDTKKFWNTVKPFLTDKGVSTRNITLVNNNKVVCTDREISNTMKKHFSDDSEELAIWTRQWTIKITQTDIEHLQKRNQIQERNLIHIF